MVKLSVWPGRLRNASWGFDAEEANKVKLWSNYGQIMVKLWPFIGGGNGGGGARVGGAGSGQGRGFIRGG